MSEVIYQVEQVLPEKILLKNNSLLTFQNILQLKKQGTKIVFIENEQNITEEINSKVEFYKIVITNPLPPLWQQLVDEVGLEEASHQYQFWTLCSALKNHKFDIEKTCKKLKIKSEFVKEMFTKNKLSLDLVKK